MSTKNRSDSGNPSPSPKVKGKQKPSAEMSVSAKSSTQVVGNQSSTGASATAKLSKEEKKRLKAERRSQKKAETGRISGPPVPGSSGSHSLKKEGSFEAKQQQHSSSDLPSQNSGKSQSKKQFREQSISSTEESKKVQLFSHLHQYEKDKLLAKSYSGLPPCLLRLATLYSSGVICGSNARCLAMLGSFKTIIQDYSTPQKKDLSRDLGQTFKGYINFLTGSRPLSVSMGNAINWLKVTISNVNVDTPEAEAKKSLCSKIDDYIYEKIVLADSAISDSCRKGIIKSGDVILTYAHSSIVTESLIKAHNDGIRFKVIVVDSRPKLEGQYTLRKLTKAGIPCSYILINAVSYIMKEVSKVLVGAHAVLTNGYVMSRIGTSLIALVARSYNVPVLVCCETYKFCEKVQTDAFVLNELGDPNDLVRINRRQGNILSEWKSLPSLGLLNLTYDVTAPSFIAMVITEVGNIPCTSVPVILRLIHNNSYQ